jgi:hypothetical protein
MVIVNVFLWTVLALVALLAVQMVKDCQAAEREKARQMRDLYRAYLAQRTMQGRPSTQAKWVHNAPLGTNSAPYRGIPARFIDLSENRTDSVQSTVEFALPSRKISAHAQEAEVSASRVFCA